MSISEKIHRIRVQNINPSDSTSLLDLVNKHVEGKMDAEGNPIRSISCQCREGFCGACKVKVIDGEYQMSDDAFSELCIDPNETLACSTKVNSSEVEIEFNL